MSPNAAQLLIGCSISFVLGGAAGVLALSTLYGDVDRVDPVPSRSLECPPPPPCPACPAPVDCGELGRIPPPSDRDAPAFDDGAVERPEDEADRALPSVPGLPASVIPPAHAAVKAELVPCLERLIDPEPGVALLQVTVRTRDGEGSARDAIVVRATGGAAAAAGCLADAARNARFDWSGPDGELTFKVPVSVGPR